MLFKVIVLFCLLILSSCYISPMRMAGDFEFETLKQQSLMGEAEQQMIQEAFTGLDLKKIRDVHVHIIGVGHNDSGIEINKNLKSILHFKSFVRYHTFLRASGVQGRDNIDLEYVQRLKKLKKEGGLSFKHHILAFDKHYLPNGELSKKHTEMYVPNKYIYKLSQEHPDLFEPVISVHPYRRDAVERLNYWGKKGVKFVKWLPNAMGMNPAQKGIEAYYETLIKWDMTLLTHVGKELSVESAGNQYLGNPLFLKKPLDMGVKILAAHGAAIGRFDDLENPGQQEEAYKLLMRLIERPQYEKLLRIDLSATLLRDRTDRVILDLLNRTDLHSRFVYGSDYPVPGVNISIPLEQMHKAGFITKNQVEPLRNIYKVNPLLFNFVFFRHIKHPETGQKYLPEAFYF